MKQKLANILKVVIFFLLPVISYPQSGNETEEVTLKKHTLNHNGMKVLTAWSIASIASGAGYFVSHAAEEKYFYAMNAGWGFVNLAIALPGLRAKKPSYKTKFELLQNQTKTEKIFLANAMLDLTYITGGFLLKEMAKNQTNTSRKAMWSGFGNSFILQGAGLLAFDVSMTILNNKFRKKNIEPLIANTQIAIAPGRIGFTRYF